MQQYYVVRRSFKAGGHLYSMGDIVTDLTSIKLYKMRISEKKIIPVPDTDEKRKALNDYFIARTGCGFLPKWSEALNTERAKQQKLQAQASQAQAQAQAQAAGVKPKIPPKEG